MSKSKKHSITLLSLKERATHCFYCDTPFIEIDSGNQPLKSIDHIDPIARGGSNRTRNKAVCCYMCQAIKNNLSLDSFLHEIDYAIEYGFKRKKFNDFYSKKKLLTMRKKVINLLNDQNNNDLKFGYFTIKKNDNDNNRVKTRVESSTVCEPCIFKGF